MVEDATHDSVTVERLDSRPSSGLSSKIGRGDGRTVDYYIREDEQPHFIFIAEKETPNVYGEDKPLVPERSRLSDIFHIVTDERWLTLVGTADGEEKLEIELSEIEATNYDTESELSSKIPDKLTNNRIVLQTESLYYEIPISNEYEEGDLVVLLGYLRKTADARPRAAPLDPDAGGFTLGGVERNEPDRETVRAVIDELPPAAIDEANELIAAEENADRLLRKLNELIEEYEGQNTEETIDDVVAEAESVEDLREEVRSPMEQKVGEAKTTAATGAEQMKDRIGRADRGAVANYALSTARIARPFAASANPSTTLLLLGSLFVGGGVGVFANTGDSDILDRIDPTELQRHASAIAGVGAELEEIDGEAVGMFLGATSYLGEVLAPEEYAEWVVEADHEAMMAGIEHGASFAAAHGGDRHLGGLFGGMVGLFGSYTAEDPVGGTEMLSQILDEDLHRELATEDRSSK